MRKARKRKMNDLAYIKEIRDLVGHRPLIMTSASGALVNDKNEVLLQAREWLLNRSASWQF